MARAQIKLRHPITELELDLDENSLKLLEPISRFHTSMNCTSCKYAIFNMFVEPCCNCNEGSEFKPKSNADRIRSMTDEELEAEFWRIYKELPKYSSSTVWFHEWLKKECE